MPIYSLSQPYKSLIDWFDLRWWYILSLFGEVDLQNMNEVKIECNKCKIGYYKILREAK